MGVMYELYGIPVYDNDIYHSGIKGMHWGIRRYQNPDGTLTPEGRKRYNVGSDGNLYDKETGKKYGLSTKAKIGIGAGAAALAGGAALAADQIFNGGRGRQAVGQFIGNNAQKAWSGAKNAADTAGNWVGNNAQKVGEAVKDFAAGDRSSANQFVANGGVAGAAGRAGDWIGNTASNAWNSAKGAADTAGDWINEQAGKAKTWWNGQEVAGPTVDGVPATTGGARRAISDAADSVNKWWNGQGSQDVADSFYRNADYYAQTAAEEAAKAGGRQTSVDYFNSLADKARNAAQTAGGMRGQIANAAGNAADWVSNRAQDAGEWVKNAYGDARDTVTGWFTKPPSIGDSVDTSNYANKPSDVYSSSQNRIGEGFMPDNRMYQNPPEMQFDPRPNDYLPTPNKVKSANQITDGFSPMSTRNYNNTTFEARRGPGLSTPDIALNGTVGTLNGVTSARSAYDAAKSEGYNDSDARRIATGAGLSAGAASTAAGLAGTAGDRALGNRFTWLGMGGQLAGALGGNLAGNAIARKAVGPSSYMSELNNKIGQHVKLDNGQEGIFRGWSTLPDGRVVPILE